MRQIRGIIMYTLSQLAHFDRCLFPIDFEEQLIEAGMDGIDAYVIARSPQVHKGIVAVYQEYVLGCVNATDRAFFQSVFDKVLANFFAKF